MAPTHINFSDVSAATVPDGTTATTANTGLSDVNIVSGDCEWGTAADGRRYIEGVGTSARTVFKLLSTATSDYIALEWELEYEGTPNSSDTHAIIDMNSGSNRLIHRHRTDASWDQKLRVQCSASNNTVLGDTYDRSNVTKGFIDIGRRNWYGAFGYKHATEGFLGITVNQQARAQYENINTSSVNWAQSPFGILRFDPMDGSDSSWRWRLYGVRYWETDDFLDEMVCDWSEDRWQYQFLDQIGPEYGPWEITSGSGTFDTDSGGIISCETRVRCTTSVTLEMREGHAFGQLESYRGRAVVRDEFICLPSGGSYDLRLGTSSAGDIGIIAFDGTSGTSTTRPIKIGGVATGLTYRDGVPYCLDIIFDETTNKSALVLTHIGLVGDTDRRQWGAWWERTGGIPEVNVITRTVIGTNAAVGMMLAAPSVDYTYPSSYTSTDTSLPSPLSSVTLDRANHIGRQLDMSPDPARGYHVGILSNTAIGRSGDRLYYLSEWTGAFDSLQYLRAQRFVFPEAFINDFSAGITVSQLLSKFQAQVNACKAYNVRMHGGSQLLLPDPEYDDDERAEGDEVNDGILSIMTNAGRPDLFTHSDVRGQYSSQAEMDAMFHTDNVHPASDKVAEWAGYFVSLMTAVGTLGQRSRSRSRER
jgi:hypothetical protein